MMKSKVALYLIFGTILCGMLIPAIFLPKATAIGENLADMDAYVDSYNSGVNYGTIDTFLAGKNPSTYEAYFHFNFPQPEGYSKVEIRISFFSVTADVNITACIVTDSWTETGVTWDTRLTHGQNISTTACMHTGNVGTTWITLDLTNYFKTGQTNVTICLNASSSAATGYIQGATHEYSISAEAPRITWYFPSDEWMPYIFYAILAVIIVIPTLLLVRYVRRRKAQSQTQSITKPLSSNKQDTRGFEVSIVAESVRIEKLKKLIQVSQKMKVAQIAKILEMSEEDLYKHIVDWASTFGFTLNEDVVDFSGSGKTDAFIDALEKEFKTWGKSTEKV